MAKLTFSGRSLDGSELLLKDDAGQTYTLAVDARLRTALRAKPDRNGQMEIPMESALRPRDIQARIRAGETPEAVAQAAGTSIDKIMPYAAPVLAERAHVAQRAQLSSMRRRSGDAGARTLGEAVEAQLHAHNVDPDTVTWDAWRREDGRWTLTGDFSAGGRTGTATYSFDVRGNFVTLDDDDARWLAGDLPDTPAATPGAATSATDEPGDDLAAARQRRLSTVSPDELPLGADAIEMVSGSAQSDRSEQSEPGAAETTLEMTAADTLGSEQPAEAYLDTPASEDGSDARSEAPDVAAQPEATLAQEAAEQPQPARKSKRRGRASVPSWDEIMFGGGKGD
jgi:hypothetical protein